MKTILFQGDSITDAGRPRDHSNNLGHGYPQVVAGKIGLDYPGQFRFVNKGCGGNRVVDLYARIKVDILNIKPDYLSILIGVNDVWHGIKSQDQQQLCNGVDAEKYFKVYDMLISEIKEELPQTKIVILEPFILHGSGTDAIDYDLFEKEIRLRAEKSRLIAEKYGLPFVPLQKKLAERAAQSVPSDVLYDGVHPTCVGHEIIARELTKAFTSLF